MWTEEEMKEVVLAFEEIDEKKKEKFFLETAQNIYLTSERARKNFHRICIREMIKTVGIIALDVIMFIMIPEKIVSIWGILFFTGTFIANQLDIKKDLEIEATDYDRNHQLFLDMGIEYFSTKKETNIYSKKYILDEKSEIKEEKKQNNQEKLKELYKVKEQILENKVEKNKQKII